MSELLMVTHPQASHHVEDRVGGWFDSHLTERGLKQARQIAVAIREQIGEDAALYSSDLRRTTQTAEAISVETGLEVQTLFELREKSYGEGEGRPDAWFRARFIPPPRHGERMDHDEGVPGAETKAQWARRVYAGMDRLMSDPAPQKVVVTHGGTATLVIAHWIGMPITSLDVVNFRVSAGSITHLVEDAYFHNRAVTRLNDTRHLD
ncbi:histidine phosphatase family protein [Solicola sp. PLA-1-18]|uniref:histidine phosphatase family protein n=1 Tax=Solicola sp. PLA-1-18 TaxID=3380532 RepID=UPI003B7EA513